MDKRGRMFLYSTLGVIALASSPQNVTADEVDCNIEESTNYQDNDVSICNIDGFELQEGWNQIYDNWYYVSQGELVKDCVKKIGEVYYGFDYEGRMYNDMEFSIYNSDSDEYVLYRAKQGGVLYQNSWYKDEYGYDIFYGEDCKKIDNGIVNKDGHNVLIKNGYIAINTLESFDEKLYYCDENGVLIEVKNNAWIKLNDNWYYIEEGEFVRDCVKMIGNSYYGFGYDGVMFKDQAFYIYKSEFEWSYYIAKKDGSLYRNTWYEDAVYHGEIYFGDDCRKVDEGIVKKDGYDVLIKEGYIVIDSIEEYNSKKYYCDNNGLATEIKDNTWYKFDNNWYYVSEGQFLKNCVKKIGNSYYGFDYKGRMYDNTTFDISEGYYDEYGNWISVYAYYAAQEGGALCRNSWKEDEYGNKLYPLSRTF